MLSNQELDELILDANKRAHSGRRERLRVLLTEGDLAPGPVSALAYEYFEEARLCWYVGASVATIVMSQLALEEMLRSHYRVVNGVQGYLKEHLSVDDAGFADLIDKAHEDGCLSSEEAEWFHTIRKHYRNPLVHPHDVRKNHGFGKPNFVRQNLKIVAPELVGSRAEDEARETIRILISTFPRVSRRMLPAP